MMNAMGSDRFTQGWAWRSSLGGVLVAASAMLGTPAAWAANASDLAVTMQVKPDDGVQPPLPQTYSVSVSRAGLDSFISYQLKVINSGGNTVNQVVFTATATVTGTPANPISGMATYAGLVNLVAASPNCPAPGATPSNTVTCSIGQLQAGESREFFLLFRAPEGGATVEFAGVTNFSEGNSSQAPPSTFTELVSNSMVLVTIAQQEVNKSVKTVLTPSGGLFFTGPNGQVSASNLFSTTVQVPPTTTTTPTVTDNRIDQNSVGSFACPPLSGYFCYGLSSAISINNANGGNKVDFTLLGAIVFITLRQDAASLTVKKPTPGLFDVKIFYTPTGKPTIELAACGTSLPVTDVPCVKDRFDHLKGNKGYYEYLIWARDNGSFSW
jgi:hypothetical protein